LENRAKELKQLQRKSKQEQLKQEVKPKEVKKPKVNHKELKSVGMWDEEHQLDKIAEKNKDIPNEVIDQIIADIHEVPLSVVSRRGHGKTTSIKTLIARLLEQHPKTKVKVFDLSTQWYHTAPLKHRVHITWGKDSKLEDLGKYPNLGNCVYEIGDLPQDEMRLFVAHIIRQDYDHRRSIALRSREAVDQLPLIVYIFEEANIYFKSSSLKRKGKATEYLNKYISIGRNYGMSGILISTVEKGEISTEIRRRSSHLYGKLLSESDIGGMKSKYSKREVDRLIDLPKYHWLYVMRGFSKPFRIRDTVKTRPETYRWYSDPVESRQRRREAEEKELELGDRIVLKLFPWVFGLLCFLLGYYVIWA
jgi:hypothetical protein